MRLPKGLIPASAQRRVTPPCSLRILRSLSTTAPKSAQLLHEYLPPKSNNMVGATRARIARIKKHESMPIYDKQIFNDVERVCELEKMSEDEKEERLKVVARLTEILTEELGPDVEVIDISPYTWGAELTGVEIELAISVKGTLDPINNTNHFKASNTDAIIELLSRHGISALSIPSTPTPGPTSYSMVYSSAGHFYIHLAPHEDHVKLRDLLNRYMEKSLYGKWLLALYRAWINSYFEEDKARGFLTTASALVVIAHLQRRRLLPNFQAEDGDATPTIDFFHPETLADIELSERKLLKLRQFKHAVGDFFSNIAHKLEFRRDMISVKEGGWVARSLSLGIPHIVAPPVPLKNPLSRKDEDLDVLDALKQEERAQYIRHPDNNSILIPRHQPEEWKRATWVVQHPFMPQVNLAQSFQGPEFQMMRSLMVRTAAQLKSTTPLPAVFGPEVPPASGLTLSQLYMKIAAPTERHPQLGEQIVTFYETQKPYPDLHRMRQRAMDDIKAIISDLPSGYRFHLDRFGSTVYCDSKKSDLDLVILDDSYPAGFPPALTFSELRRTPIYNMKWLATEMKKSGKFDRIQPISTAAVPIVKAIHKDTGVRIDVNTNDRLGLCNTQLLQRYSELCPSLPTLVFSIKRWANALGMNDPSGQHGPVGFSSYCLTLMLIFYLQTRGILPSLQADIKEPNKVWFDTTKWVRLANDQRLQCDTRFGNAEDWEVMKYEIEDVLAGFFRYWGSVHNYGNNIASIKEGVPVPRTIPIGQAAIDRAAIIAEYQDGRADGDDYNTFVPSDEDLQSDASSLRSGWNSDKDSIEVFEQPASWTQRILVVQDPFLLIKNVASNVDKGVLERFRVGCMRVYSQLNSGQPLSSIFPDNYDLGTDRRAYQPHSAVVHKRGGYATTPGRQQRRFTDARHYSTTSGSGSVQQPVFAALASHPAKEVSNPRSGSWQRRPRVVTPSADETRSSRGVATVSWTQRTDGTTPGNEILTADDVLGQATQGRGRGRGGRGAWSGKRSRRSRRGDSEQT
ncbi:hypothetical protein CALVIDRAFT_541427 [Calocera viscosa TUFC12733]|uniref:Poly(A) RNA polymerase mitochondrial-like central palm domain-containing protein n=1 Tax=Calocera viscosa (strain TUFC12733) TaxID=1330018 RepID=A0A167HSR0_CALVF|nr:hypothetical protein CALVIDRAFT_541427 [Calocera viscosa TUFC12733]